jgi:hypothetical protein
MFLLARAWGLGFWGRWFAGLVYPFCGFLVVWLLFPVTAVAIWLPWLVLATDRLFGALTLKAAGGLAVVVALVIFGGHIQTSAHVLLAAGLYAAAAFWQVRFAATRARRALILWTFGTALGLSVAAVQLLPLGFYLAKSSVWKDRRAERPDWWVFARPRALDTICTAFPYVYGSQRRGHPNLARALGVHNLNESAGGFAGLATLIWLAPLAVVTQGRTPRVVYLSALVVCGALGAFRWPPIDNLLRSLPVLDVTDNRRLTLWVAFGLTLLGGVGLDQLWQSHRLTRPWLALWVAGALLFASSACAIRYFEPQFRQRATAHYARAASLSPAADPIAYQRRAERQIRQTVSLLPRYHALAAVELLVLAALAAPLRRRHRCPAWVRPAMLGLTLCELTGVFFGLNPSIDRRAHEYEPPVVARLRRGMPPGGRAIGLGQELPPNALMRFGLADVRNYDSVELARSLQWFAPLYQPGGSALSSRSEITWERVAAARERLCDSGLCAVVAATPPPDGVFDRVEKVSQVWIAWLDGRPWADSEAPGTRLNARRNCGFASLEIDAGAPEEVTLRETWDPGWTALLDGKPIEIEPKLGVFLNFHVPSGRHTLILKYDPLEVRLGLAVSICSLVLLILVLTGIRLFWIPGITMAKGLDGLKPAS